jgi:ribose transport system permease protein
MKRLLSEYGMLPVLLLLSAYYSWATWGEQQPTGEAAGRQVAAALAGSLPRGARVLIVARMDEEERAFAAELETRLASSGLEVARTVRGTPADARRAILAILGSQGRLDAIACTSATRAWRMFDDPGRLAPALAGVRLFSPRSYRWPRFLNANNLLNVASQIAVIAIIAIGMTMVIITGGIDLSVGSLIALSSVVAAMFIARLAGGEQAGATGMVLGCLAGVAVCAAMGLFTGVAVTFFDIPPFIVTLSIMLVGSGVALQEAQGQSISELPASFVWLGGGKTLGGVPNSVILMLLLYVAAHFAMSRMAIGRYIYAVGGNRQAARLSGVPVAGVLLLVYTLSGALAGLAGIVLASQLKSGSPIYGSGYELFVIAAVVVGGTSISGGEGNVLKTLIGALIIAVIQNGMNLTGIGPYPQKTVLGLVILAAVLLDTLKRKGFLRLASRRRQP